MARDRHRAPEAVRITSAASSREADIAHRERRYVISMAIRTVCFIGAVVAGVGFGLMWLCWVLIAASLLLPYVAVVAANAGETRQDAFELPDTTYRPELGPGQAPADHPADHPADGERP